jgi:hypothetical protein
MKKRLNKDRLSSNGDDFPITGRHIHLLRILAFASESINFTEEENAHFDVCRDCRLMVIDALRNLTGVAPAASETTIKAA